MSHSRSQAKRRLANMLSGRRRRLPEGKSGREEEEDEQDEQDEVEEEEEEEEGEGGRPKEKAKECAWSDLLKANHCMIPVKITYIDSRFEASHRGVAVGGSGT